MCIILVQLFKGLFINLPTLTLYITTQLSLTSVTQYESNDTLQTIFILHGPWHDTKHHGCNFESKCLLLKVRKQHEDTKTWCLPIKSLPF